MDIELNSFEKARLKALNLITAEMHDIRNSEAEQEYFGLWVERQGHAEFKPAETQREKEIYSEQGYFKLHCAPCLNTNGCWFAKTPSKAPPKRLHENCHCTEGNISNSRVKEEARARCEKGKAEHAYGDPAKLEFFIKNGYGPETRYDIIEFMRKSCEKIGQEKYSKGKYRLGVLDMFGQRITIKAELPRIVGDEKAPFHFDTGWMVYPFGKISCNSIAASLKRKKQEV